MSRRWSADQFPSGPQRDPLKRAAVALSQLRAGYDSCLEGHTSTVDWEECDRRHEHAVAVLSEPDVATAIDDRVRELLKAGEASPVKGLEFLRTIDRGRKRGFERSIAKGLGFSTGDFDRFVKLASRGLRRAVAGTANHPLHTTEVLVSVLNTGHSRAVSTFNDTRGMHWRKGKGQRRTDAKLAAKGCVYTAGLIVGDVDYPHAFRYSYALGSGVSANIGLT